jgi:hypothetical protein
VETWRGRASALGGAAVLLVVTLGSCRDPTEVTLEIASDQPCGVLDGVAIAAGQLDAIASQPAGTITRACTPTATGSRYGTLVLTPSGAKDEHFAVQVTGSIGVTVEACSAGTPVATHAPGTGCIVARRVMAFLPHTPLYLPIVLQKSCLDHACEPDQTCDNGVCVTAVVPDPAQCKTPTGCAEPTDATAPDDARAETGANDDAAPTDANAGDGDHADATRDAGACLLPPNSRGACHTQTAGTACSDTSGNAAGPCVAPDALCCSGSPGAACASVCSGQPGSLQYEFACDEPQDCAAGDYCVATRVAGPGGGAQCQPPASACAGARICKDDCDCDAGISCQPVTCSASLNGTTIQVPMKTCGTVCP